MVKIRISRRTSLIVIFLTVVIISCLGVFTVLNKDKSQQEPTAQDTAKSSDSANPEPAANILEPPHKSTPEICKNANEDVISIVAVSGLTMTAGREARTDDDSNMTDCNYSKDDTRVNVRVYEYENATDAEAGITKLQVTGYKTMNKDKYVASVLVLFGNVPNADTADKLLDAVLERF